MGYNHQFNGVNFDRDGTLFWRQFMLNDLREGSRPLLVFEETTVPAASLWSGARRWIDELSRAGMTPGDRIVLSLPPGPAFVELLLACFWDEYTLVVSPPGSDRDPATLTEKFHARLSVGEGREFTHSLDSSTHGPDGSLELRDPGPEDRRDPDLRLVQASGDEITEPFVGFTTENLLSQIHEPPEAAATISLDSWHRADSLVTNLLSPLLGKRRLLVPSRRGQAGRKLLSEVDPLESSVLYTAGSYAGTGVLSSVLEAANGPVTGFVRAGRSAFRRGQKAYSSRGNLPESVTMMLSTRKACGPPVVRTDGSPTVVGTGERIRCAEERSIEVLTNGAAAVLIHPANGSVKPQPVPRWIDTGLRETMSFSRVLGPL